MQITFPSLVENTGTGLNDALFTLIERSNKKAYSSLPALWAFFKYASVSCLPVHLPRPSPPRGDAGNEGCGLLACTA